VKLFMAILFEARTNGGQIRRLTPAKAARVAVIPVAMAAVAIGRLTGPDEMDSSGVAEGRRLLPNPDGGPNDYIVTNWESYGREFERASKTARQRRWRAKRTAAPVDENVYTASTRRRSVDGAEAQEEKKRSRKETPSSAFSSFFEDRWSRYPKKDGKKLARRDFLRTVTDEIQLARFDRALSNYLAKIAAEKTAMQYVKNGSTFFANWEDFVDYEVTPETPTTTPRLVV
jgi:hypothetical protein